MARPAPGISPIRRGLPGCDRLPRLCPDACPALERPEKIRLDDERLLDLDGDPRDRIFSPGVVPEVPDAGCSGGNPRLSLGLWL
jgi:hypothetical protein